MSAKPAEGEVRFRELADGNRIPALGLGVWQIPNGKPCVDAVRWALELGYRHIDTAQDYGNEESVGEGLRASGVPREDVFITTKFYPGHKDPAAEAERSLKRLGLDYLDLYIVHWPQGGPTWAWRGMERTHDLGYARSIGVSNFDIGELEEVMNIAKVTPVIDQVQLSPFEYRRALIDAARRRSVVVEAYSPLGTGRHISNETVKRIATRLERTPAQILLRWSIQHELVVIPKSANRERIEENAQIEDFTLSRQEMSELDTLDRTNGTDRAQEDKWW